MTRQAIFFTLMACTVLYALIRGGGPERVVAAILVAALAGSVAALTGTLPNDRYGDVELGVLAVDLATWLALLVTAVLANRYWPIWITALQGVELLAHLLGLVASPLLNLLYAIAVQFWSYPMLALLTIGVWRHRTRVARLGSDPSWRRSSSAAQTESHPR